MNAYFDSKNVMVLTEDGFTKIEDLRSNSKIVYFKDKELKTTNKYRVEKKILPVKEYICGGIHLLGNVTEYSKITRDLKLPKVESVEQELINFNLDGFNSTVEVSTYLTYLFLFSCFFNIDGDFVSYNKYKNADTVNFTVLNIYIKLYNLLTRNKDIVDGFGLGDIGSKIKLNVSGLPVKYPDFMKVILNLFRFRLDLLRQLTVFGALRDFRGFRYLNCTSYNVALIMAFVFATYGSDVKVELRKYPNKSSGKKYKVYLISLPKKIPSYSTTETPTTLETELLGISLPESGNIVLSLPKGKDTSILFFPSL